MKLKSLLAAFLSTALIAGCGVNWEEVHKAQERESMNLLTWADSLKSTLAPPPRDAGDTAWVAYQVRMAGAGELLRSMRPDTLETVLTYAYKHDQQLYNWLSLALNNPVTAAATREVFGDNRGGAGGIQFGGKGSTFEDMRFDIANDGSIVAKDEANAVSDDSQQLNDSDQNQVTRSTTRPLKQDQPSTAGGSGDESPGAPIHNNSEGFALDALTGD